jgi:AhpD family alkylhydroperoxidase
MKHEIVGYEYESGHLDEKTLHLIAMATHLAAGNGYCASFRVRRARKAGASRAEIREAIGMAIRAGASLVFQEALDHFKAGVMARKK